MNGDFFELWYQVMLRGEPAAVPPEDKLIKLFTSKRNRVEIIDDFPMDDNANMVPSLEVFVRNCF